MGMYILHRSWWVWNGAKCLATALDAARVFSNILLAYPQSVCSLSLFLVRPAASIVFVVARTAGAKVTLISLERFVDCAGDLGGVRW